MEFEYIKNSVSSSKELILKEAFKLFLQKNVEKVTIDELERATKLRRGAIFYYFKDKKNIFKEVIDKYFFSPLNMFYPIQPDNIFLLKDYWELKNNHISKIQDWLREEKVFTNPYLAFFHIAEQANLYLPNFNKKMLEMVDLNRLYWQCVAAKDSILLDKIVDNPKFLGNYFEALYWEQCYISCYDAERAIHNNMALLYK